MPDNQELIEAARLWAYFHKDWLLSIRSLLRPQLPPQYFVFVESETHLVTPDADEACPAAADGGPQQLAVHEASAGSARAIEIVQHRASPVYPVGYKARLLVKTTEVYRD